MMTTGDVATVVRGTHVGIDQLGVLYVPGISGIHRAIGVHITKIKSITLDKWTSEVDHMKKVGNVYITLGGRHFWTVDEVSYRSAWGTRRFIRANTTVESIFPVFQRKLPPPVT